MLVQVGTMALAIAAASSSNTQALDTAAADHEQIRRCEKAAVVVVDAYTRESTNDTARTALLRQQNASFKIDPPATDPGDRELIAAYSSVALQLPEYSAEERSQPLTAATQIRLAARAAAVCAAVTTRQGTP